MHCLLPFVLTLVAQVYATRYDNGLKYERRGLFNETVGSFTNTSTTSTTSTTSSTPSSSSLTTASSTSSTSSSIPPLVCIGTVTYYGSIPPTTYLTVTEGFDVTLTASNASLTASDTLITPPPACESTIMPWLGSFQPLATIFVSSNVPAEDSSDPSHTESKNASTSGVGGSRKPSISQQLATTKSAGDQPPMVPQVPPPAIASGVATAESRSYTIVKSTIYATAPYTSTVIVTRKTPVVVVSPQTNSPPPVFQDPEPNQNNQPPSSDAGNGNPSSPSNGPQNDNPAPRPGVVPDPAATNSPGLGNVIVSLIRTQAFVPVPTVGAQTTVANLPVAVLPSSVLIGGSAVAIPSSAEVVVTIDDQVFTVRPSEVAAPGDAVIGFDGLNALQMQPSPTQRVTIVPGVVAEVGGDTAVIQGTTYRIGSGATPTTITVNGVPVGIGPLGLSLPSTTVGANAVADAPKVVKTAAGLTFSIDQSEVVIGGTTYRIGSGASTLVTEIDGQTISIGPGGVGLETSTFRPTSATAMTGSRSSEGAAATSALVQGGGAARLALDRIGMKEMLGWTIILLGCGRLLL